VMGALVLVGVIVTTVCTKEHPQETPKVDKWKIIAGSIGEVWRDRTSYPSLFRFLIMNLFFWFGLGAFIARMSRATLLEVLGEDYVRTARAKGLAEAPVILKHVLKNACIPVVTLLGLKPRQPPTWMSSG